MSISEARGEFANLAHVRVNGRRCVTRESAEQLAADILKRAKSVSGIVCEMSSGKRRAS